MNSPSRILRRLSFLLISTILGISVSTSSPAASPIAAPSITSLHWYPFEYPNIFIGWSCRDTSIKHITILRRIQTESSYTRIKTVQADSNGCWDAVTLPQMMVYYRLVGISGAMYSDTSTVDSVEANPEVINTPVIPRASWHASENCVEISFTDNASSETGYRIYRANGDPSSSWAELVTLPPQSGKVTWADTTASPNTWYSYTVAVLDNMNEIGSNVAHAFTLDPKSFVELPDRRLSLGDKVSSFDIAFSGWVILTTDTLRVWETNAPSSSHALYEVHTPETAAFLGYRADTTGATTAMPPQGCTIGEYLLSWDLCSCYRYINGSLQKVWQRAVEPFTSHSFARTLDDSIFVMQTYGRREDNFGIYALDAKELNACGWYSPFEETMAEFANRSVYFRFFSSNKLYLFDTRNNLLDSTLVVNAFSVPRISHGFIIDEPELLNARNFIIDTVKSCVYVLDSNSLEIYRYSAQEVDGSSYLDEILSEEDERECGACGTGVEYALLPLFWIRLNRLVRRKNVKKSNVEPPL